MRLLSSCRACCAAALLAAGSAFAVPVTWTDAATIATGNGVRGPWQQNESRYDFVDDGTVAVDPQGNTLVAWVDQARKQVLLQRYSQEGRAQYQQPVAVSRSPDHFSWLPRIALAPGDPRRVYMVWQDIIFSGGSHGGDIMFARSDDDGATFSAPVNLSDSIQGAGKGRISREFWHNGSYDLAAAPDGTVHVVWTEFEGRLLHVRSGDGGATFSAPRHLSGSDDMPARGPSLAAGNNGVVYLAWTAGDSRQADIRVARSIDGGRRFEAPVLAMRTSNYSDAPKIAVHDDGTLHLAFAESTGGPFDRFRILYLRSRDGLGSFSEPKEISAPPPGNAVGAHFPSLSLDGNGNPVVVWESVPRENALPQGLGIAVSRDGGRSFSAPAMVWRSRDPDGGINGSTQGRLMRKLDVNDAGQIAVVNSSFRDRQASRVWLLLGTLDAAHK